jgi:hypothetical protein
LAIARRTKRADHGVAAADRRRNGGRIQHVALLDDQPIAPGHRFGSTDGGDDPAESGQTGLLLLSAEITSAGQLGFAPTRRIEHDRVHHEVGDDVCAASDAHLGRLSAKLGPEHE